MPVVRGQWLVSLGERRRGRVAIKSENEQLTTGTAKLLLAAVGAALLAWLSQGTIALATPDGPRIALLPASFVSIATSALAGGLVFGLLRAEAPLAPLALLVLTVLPWLPVPVPVTFLIWAGRLRLLVWAGVLLLLAVRPAQRVWAQTKARARVEALVSARPQLVAGILSALLFGASAWAAAPSVPGGDEPHYLIITQSLLRDGDLRIENNHLRGDYQPYFGGQLRPDYLRRGRDGEIYSIHSPGIPAIVAPAFALGGYPAVVLFLIGISALGGALLWHVAWLATGSGSAAWFGWAAIALSPTLIFHTFTVYPDGVGGFLVLTAFWGLLRLHSNARAWLLHGTALALLPWLHARFALLAGSLGALLLLRLSRTLNAAGNGVALLAVPAFSAFFWVGYFIAIYGTPDPSAPYGSAREFSTAFIPGGLTGLLFDQRFGLIATAPVLVLALVGLGMMVAGERPLRRLALELLFVVVPYLLIATSYAMWWGGWSAPARFAAVVLPPLVIPCAVAWSRLASPALRTIAASALALTGAISAVLLVPERGRLAYNTRELPALWLDWASQIADLGRGLPLWVRGGEGGFFREIVVWAGVLGLATAATGFALRRRRVASLEARATIVILVLGGAIMAAVAATWRLNDVGGTTAATAQLSFLRALSDERRVVTAVLHPLDRIGPGEVLGMMRIEPGARYSSVGGAGRNARPLVTLPAVPAGRYRIRAETDGGGGLLMIGIGRDQFLLQTHPIASPPQAVEIEFPVDVRALIVNGDERARRSITAITIEPVSTVRHDDRLTDAFARTGVRYADTSVFFLDDRSFPEPEAFWVGGARQSSVVIQPDTPARRITLFLRNAPVRNQASIEIGFWRQTFELSPGEERYVEVPLDINRGGTLATFSSRAGFRPSEVDANSRDTRFLGIWVQVARP